MKKRLIWSLVFIGIFLYICLFLFSINKVKENSENVLIKDVGHLYPTYVKKIVKENQLDQIKEIITDANNNGLKVSIAGSQHSQGGHTYYDDAVVLNMMGFNKIINLDTNTKILTVQSGTTWDEVQRYINPYNLSIKVMQSSNIFTVGGTLSANAHGRDLDSNAMVETVTGFRFLLANGTILNVSRIENSELFSLVIGGYGMFGVILDVDLELTDNEVYKTTTNLIDYKDFPNYFEDHIKKNESIALMLVRPSISPSNLFEEFAVLTWEKTNEPLDPFFELTEEKNVIRDKFLFGLSRKYDWGKELRWNLQKKIESKQNRFISRNNGMRPPEAPLELLEHNSLRDTDILQEYFIPTRSFINFSETFIKILKEDEVNVLSFTIRYVSPNNDSLLSYAPKEEAFAIIYYSNIKISEKELKKTEKTVQKIVDAAIQNDGTYYLTYNLYPTQEQIRASYPSIDLAFLKKKEYDPNETFMSKFYAKYANGEEDEKYWQI
ncbi:MAG: FAD-binding oxidoreductase [Nanoarchaeota archaeon]